MENVRKGEKWTDTELKMVIFTDGSLDDMANSLGRTKDAINMIRRKAQRIVEGKWHEDTITNKIRDIMKEKFQYLE